MDRGRWPARIAPPETGANRAERLTPRTVRFAVRTRVQELPTMPTRSRADLVQENAAIRIRLAELEQAAANTLPKTWSGLERRGIERTGLTVALRESEIRYRRLF